jgi:hypothetical protein
MIVMKIMNVEQNFIPKLKGIKIYNKKKQKHSTKKAKNIKKYQIVE